MCPKPLRQISTKLILVIDLRWSQIKFDLLVFCQFSIPHAIVKTISQSRKQPSSKQRKQFQPKILKVYVTANDAVLRDMQNQSFLRPGSGTSWYTVTNPKEDLKGITTRKLGVPPRTQKQFNHDTEVTKDTMPPANNGSTEDVQPPIVQIQSGNPNPEPNVSPVDTPFP
ncbi:hypothetical protein Tco_0628637 [Tanacetum coccineum]|uniref:Uncharacterized protein n=1 Tax=Tanacetum coccineum TaxID=301880 RepID=A0ABQ4WQV7_9ASTR